MRIGFFWLLTCFVSFFVMSSVLAAHVKEGVDVYQKVPPPLPVVRVAFVGNSYTYFNDLPSMLSSMCTSAGVRLETEQLTVGGQTLKGHSSDSRLLSLLSPDKHWDYVVLQDNSSVPGRAREDAFEASLSSLRDVFVPAVARLAEKNPRIKVLLYESWGHHSGSVYKDLLPFYPDFSTMTLKTSSGYAYYQSFLLGLLPSTVSVHVVPVGSAFFSVHEECSRELFDSLYVDDLFHPSRFGTYLSACVFFRAVVLGGRGGERNGDGATDSSRCEGVASMPDELRSDEPTPFETDRMKKEAASEKGSNKGGKWTGRGITSEEMRSLQRAADKASDVEEERQRTLLLLGAPTVVRADGGGDL